MNILEIRMLRIIFTSYSKNGIVEGIQSVLHIIFTFKKKLCRSLLGYGHCMVSGVVPKRRVFLSSTDALLLLRQKYQNTQVTDIGPKDSNFPQNAWGLLDSTAHDHIFSVIPGNSDHIFSVIPGNSDAIRTRNVKKQG